MKKYTRKQKHIMIRILVTGSVLLFITFFGLILPLRTTVSESEKRELSRFPSFSFSALFSGSYFSDISTWFSDTVPFRDRLTALNGKLQNFLGTEGALAGFNEGNAGDDIPEPVSYDETPEQTTQESETAGETTTHTVLPDEEVQGNYETIGSILIYKDAGYEYYNFVQDTADLYVNAVNRAAANTDCTVYTMVVPLSIAITLNTGVQKKISSDDQQKATDYMLGSMSNKVKTVPIFDTLVNHRNEYIYFRTDHHWTALGAYYAYLEFCNIKGLTPLNLSELKKQSFSGFLGTFYNDSGQSNALAANPDTVDAYTPNCNYHMTVTDTSGNTYRMPVIYDETNGNAAYKYSAFLSGDNPYAVIENDDMPSGESILVVKESFGNAFVPYLIAHYKTVYVVDYRYNSADILSLAAENGCSDILFINNISMTRSSSLVEKFSSRIK